MINVIILQKTDDVELSMRTVQVNATSHRVTLFLTNRAPEDSGYMVKRVYQPQIRINLGPTCELGDVSSRPRVEQDEESESLKFLYRHRKGLARGHMVSATWKEIDPERFLNTEQKRDFWIDGNLLDSDIRDQFICPDIRTEYLPSVSIISPNLNDWPGFSDTPPLLIAEDISSISSGDELYRLLSPLSDELQAQKELLETLAIKNSNL